MARCFYTILPCAKFHVQVLCMGHLSEEYVQVGVLVQFFVKKSCFCGKLLVPTQPPSLRTTPCRLSALLIQYRSVYCHIRMTSLPSPTYTQQERPQVSHYVSYLRLLPTTRCAAVHGSKHDYRNLCIRARYQRALVTICIILHEWFNSWP